MEPVSDEVMFAVMVLMKGYQLAKNALAAGSFGAAENYGLEAMARWAAICGSSLSNQAATEVGNVDGPRYFAPYTPLAPYDP